jgi:hypothetical protein
VSESATQTSGPSLEQILWRAMDRWQEKPAVLDAEEFAEHIAHAFDAELPEESFAERFFAGADKMHQKPPGSVAEAALRAARQRLHAYQFDLSRLEYVIVEDKDKVVVVSEFGQFALRNDDAVGRALEAAVVKAPERGGGEPRGYFVRGSGEVVGVDVMKVARTLERLLLRQISTPAVDAPAKRLAFFNPVRRPLSAAREERALRQDPRLSRPPQLPSPEAPGKPRTAAPGSGFPRAALFVVMPDGSVARARIGAATRWEEMLGQHARTVAQPVSIESQNVVAIVSGAVRDSAGQRAVDRADALVAVRSEGLPVRALGGDALARAVVAGARVATGGRDRDRFWIQPEESIRPDVGVAEKTLVVAPLQLGQITGDPWADWSLTAGGARLRGSPPASGQGGDRPAHLRAPAAGEAARLWIEPARGTRRDAPAVPDKAIIVEALQPGRITADSAADEAGTARMREALRAAADRELPFPQPIVEAARGIQGNTLQFAGAPVVAFRAPDGSLLVNRDPATIRLAAVDRPDAPLALRAKAQLAPRTGAMPSTTLQTLQIALERTAAAGAYRLPIVRLPSAVRAMEAGTARGLDRSDDRRHGVPLAGPVGVQGRTARLVLAMPFPNQGALHVGHDLSDALDTYLAASVVPAQPDDLSLSPRGEDRAAPGPLRALHGEAQRSAEDAILTLDLPAVQPLLGRHRSISGLPYLLHRAVAQSGDWTAGPGSALPGAVRDLVLAAPFGPAPEVRAQPDAGHLAAIAPRSAGPGEEEIVIPLPLWAQMGRGALAETDRIMAAPRAPVGYAPPFGIYRLVVPGGGPIDLIGSAPAEVAINLSGPTGLRLMPHRPGTVTATTSGGNHFLGRVPLNEAGSSPRGRSRVRVGAPLQGADLSALVASAREPRTAAPALSAPRPSTAASQTPALDVAPGARSTAVAAQAAGRGRGGSAIPLAGSSSREAPSGSGGTASVSRAVASSSASVTRRPVAGLEPGIWSGHRPSAAAYYQRWSYGRRYRDEPQTVGGVELSGLSRPAYPQLPIALRFRYAGAPLWWSSASREARLDLEGESSAPSRAMLAGLRAANSAASIWRSILVAGARQDDVTGGMDTGRDSSAEAMSSVARRLDAFAAPVVAVAPPPTGSSAAPAYIAMSGSGAAGTISGTAAARARAQAVEMSIVAAIPPAPPPLQSMSSAGRHDMVSANTAPHARGRGQCHPAFQDQAKDAEDPVSQSKIEGSVDAIAQRIYHRIRRRIQSDRERFGG